MRIKQVELRSELANREDASFDSGGGQFLDRLFAYFQPFRLDKKTGVGSDGIEFFLKSGGCQ